jgi:hypothetical protein
MSLRQGVLSEDSMMNRIDSYAEEMADAVDRNFVQWPIHSMYVWPNPYYGNTYAEDINYMKNWISNRLIWMDAFIPGNTCSTSTDKETENSLFSIRAYPNPAIGEFNLEIQNVAEGTLQLEIFNITGELVWADDPGMDPYLTRRISLPPGVYTIRVTNGSVTKTVKVIIQ